MRRLAGLEYPAHPRFETPEYREGTRFAVFLYAAAGIIGDPEAAIDGEVFLEITDGATSLHVNAELFYQGESLKAFKSLHVTYGAGQDPMVQGLCSLAIDYKPALYGGAIIGFFAKPGPGDPPVLWAVYGESNINFFIVETSSDFIVCNDGLLANLNIAASFSSSIISIEGTLDASVWYYEQTKDVGAFGRISALVSAGGASVQGTLLGALISTGGERFLYAQGNVNVDLILWDGDLSAWASYSSAGWEAGKGSNPEFEHMIADARRQAESIERTARQAADDVAAALKALEDARYVEELMKDLDRDISEYRSVENARNDMNQKIANVMELEGEISGRLRSTIDHTVELRDFTAALARDLQDPLSWDSGSISGDPEKIVVEANPTIVVDQGTAQNNESELLEFMQESIELQLEHYEDAIAKTLLSLRELEMTIEGRSEISLRFLDACIRVLGTDFENRIGTYTFDSGIGFQFSEAVYHNPWLHGTAGGPMDMYTGMYLSDLSGRGYFTSTPVHSFHHLSERFSEAVESVKMFYSLYIGWVYGWLGVYESKSEDHYVQASTNLIIETEERYESVSGPLDEMHAAFTASLDILYTLKAEITATLYGMVEEYFALRAELPERVATASMELRTAEIRDFTRITTLSTDISQEDASAELAALRNELAQMLEPPVITSFILIPGDPGTLITRNWTDIQWQANHPLGVAETSLLIQSTRRSAGTGQFASAGGLESLRHYTWKPASDLLSGPARREVPAQNTYNIALRARSSGGNTTIRSASVSLRIDSDGKSSPAGEQLHDDVPPPSAPTVELPYRSVLSATSPAWQPEYSPTTGSFGTSGSGTYLENIYFTADGARISLSITAHDEQSDIRKFEYALGSYRGGADVVDWKEVAGVTSSVGTGRTGVSRRMETTMRGLNLEHGVRYFISVRVTNSAGGTAEFSMSDPLVYDSTPPSAPGAVTHLQTTGFKTIAFGTSTPVTYPVVTEAPAFEPGRINYPSVSNYREPSLTREWSIAEDAESGIWGYEYILTTVESAGEAFMLDGVGFTAGPRITITGEPATYTGNLYLHVRSRNNAGSVSTTALTYGPIVLADPSAPTPPKVNVKVGSNSVVLYIPWLSGDFESQVKGYQYSIGTAPGAADIRGWSAGIDIGHPWQVFIDPSGGAYITPEPAEVPRHSIPSGEFPLQATADLYVNVRAVNGQDMVSPVVASGPFRYNTRPEEPVIDHVFDRVTGDMTLDIGNIFDSGVPVSSVSYRVRDIATGETIQDWTNVSEFIGGKFTSPRSVTTSTSVGTDVGGSGLAVDAKVTNSVGRSSLATFQKTMNLNQISPMTTTLGGIRLF